MKSIVEKADPIVSASDTDGFAGMTGDEQNVFQEIQLGRCHRDCGREGGVGGAADSSLSSPDREAYWQGGFERSGCPDMMSFLFDKLSGESMNLQGVLYKSIYKIITFFPGCNRYGR